MKRKKQKFKGSAPKKGISSRKKMTLGAQRMRKGSDIPRVTEHLERPPLEHFLESRAGGGPSGALLTTLQMSLVRGPL